MNGGKPEKNANIELHRQQTGDHVMHQRDMGARAKFRASNRTLILMAVAFFLLLLFSVSLFVVVSPDRLYLSYILEISSRKLRNFLNYISGRGAEGSIQFTINRSLIASLAGATLAAVGVSYQAVLRNALAAPTTMGVQAGGMIGNIIYVIFFLDMQGTSIRFSEVVAQLEQSTVFERSIQQLLVIAGCFAVVFISFGILIFVGRGNVSSSHLIVTGTLFSMLSIEGVMVAQYYVLGSPYGDVKSQILMDFQLGSFNRAFTGEHLAFMAVLILPCIAVLVLLAGRMDFFIFGGETAASMGVNVRLFRIVVIAVGTLATSAVIAFCGNIAFVGIAVPNAARRIVGPGVKRLLVASMLLGAILMLLVYDLAQLFSMTAYIGLFTNLVGALLLGFAFFKGRGVARASG